MNWKKRILELAFMDITLINIYHYIDVKWVWLADHFLSISQSVEKYKKKLSWLFDPAHHTRILARVGLGRAIVLGHDLFKIGLIIFL